MDALPLELLQTHAVEDLVILLPIEVPLGDSFVLRRGRLEENKWYFAGWRKDACLFEVNLTLRPRARTGSPLSAKGRHTRNKGEKEQKVKKELQLFYKSP